MVIWESCSGLSGGRAWEMQCAGIQVLSESDLARHPAGWDVGRRERGIRNDSGLMAEASREAGEAV